jgi:hypothetical protein
MDYTSEVWKLIKWKTIIFKGREKIFQVENTDPESSGSLTLDSSRLPCTNEYMLNLMYYSQGDILVTGDQSITDVISCSLANDKLNQKIWYQRVPWKDDFIREFSALCSDGALVSDESSCGTLEMTNICDLKKVKDFRIYGREQLEKVIKLVSTFKDEIFELNKIIEDVEEERRESYQPTLVNWDKNFLEKLTLF